MAIDKVDTKDIYPVGLFPLAASSQLSQAKDVNDFSNAEKTFTLAGLLGLIQTFWLEKVLEQEAPQPCRVCLD